MSPRFFRLAAVVLGLFIGAMAGETSAAAVVVGAFARLSGSKDSCLLLTLQPGNYTAQVTGKNNGTGVALIEVYEINN